ncbi:CPBP family intramembrane glutamic endopeptidase [Parerythrobacter aestuarii]|uniref:CPBP family intramembrane glutamic endopeptidase n=1 Tax=Parerythrobacter aestuarii TaxID=3020909 RepID=UPI0024DEAE93|nr:CPBP family intramembrane glutamic endopeptidase [Parerythrobacter aestuarii]
MSTETDIRPLGWGRFVLQFVSVVIVYLAASVPAVLVFGESNTGYLLSVFMSMVAALLVAWAWLQRDGALAEAWNLKVPREWPRASGVALGGTAAIFAIFVAGGAAVEALGFEPVDVELVMQFVTESPLSLALWIVLVAWLAAGLGEELLWRGFLLDRLMRLPGISGRLWIAIVIQAGLFGLPHIYQGWGGVLVTGTIGLLLGWLRVVARWNLWPLVFAHAAVDTIMMGLGYASVQGWIEAS